MSWARTLIGLMSLASCRGEGEVELRLYRCEGIAAPMTVRLEIQGYDGGGQAVGEKLSKVFTIADPAVFSDGFATVGFVPPKGVVVADFTVVWAEDGAETSASYPMLAVPPLGEVMVLGDDACTGGATTTATSDPTTGEPTTSTTGTSTGTGTGTETGTSSSTSTTQTDTSTSTTTETGTSTGTGTGSEGTSTGTTGPVPGGDCPGKDGNVECSQGVDQVGTLVKCVGDVWVSQDAPTICDPMGVCPGVTNPKVVGCFGDGEIWACACVGVPGEPCGVEGEVFCDQEIMKLDLCLFDGGDLVHHTGSCNCGDVDGHTTCKF